MMILEWGIYTGADLGQWRYEVTLPVNKAGVSATMAKSVPWKKKRESFSILSTKSMFPPTHLFHVLSTLEQTYKFLFQEKE